MVDALLASLLQCKGITELDLKCGLNFAQWAALLANLPLKKLTIRGGELKSLDWQSLEELTIEDFYQPSSGLSHLYALRRLHTLHLHCASSSSCVNDGVLASLSLPRLPDSQRSQTCNIGLDSPNSVRGRRLSGCKRG